MRLVLLLLSVGFFFGCIKRSTGLKFLLPQTALNTRLSSDKDLKSFKFLDISPPVSAVISNSAISADIPSSVSLAALAPTLEITGTYILADGKVQENGKTKNDFRKPVSYSILAEDGSKSDYTVTLNNTGFSILGSSGNVNITGLSASDAALEMYYDTSGNYFSAFDGNTKIGTVLPNTTNFALSFKSMPTGKTCSLTAGTTSGILSSDVSFSVNCISGYLVGGKILSRLSTFTVGANSASVTTVVGSMPPTASPGTSDGIGGAARLSTPVGVTSDGKDLYIADSGNHCIRKYEISTGNVTTLAGLCGTSGTADGTGASARFNFPIQISSDGTNLFICDRANNMIRKAEISTGNVTTLIGSGGASGDQNGIGTSARINFPNGITTDGNYLYISDRGNNKIKRMMISSGVVTTVAGDGTPASVDSANGLTASLNVPCDSVSVSGILYFVDCNGNTLRKIQLSPPFPVSTIAGNGAAASIDGTGLSASFDNPHGIETDGTNLFITEYNGKKIRRVGISGLDTVTLAGSIGYLDGTGTGAFLGNLGGITTDGNRLYFVDPTNHALRRIDNPPD